MSVNSKNASENSTTMNIAAIRRAVELGKRLQERLPQIAEEYRQGDSLTTIVQKHNITEEYAIKPSTAMAAVRFAIAGYDARVTILKEKTYDGLIPREEYDTLTQMHKEINLQKVNLRLKKDKDNGILKGIYAMTKEDRIASGQKGAATQITEHIGIHSQGYIEHQRVGQMASLARGDTIWSNTEKLSALEMATRPNDEYRLNSTLGIKKLATQKIARELNKEYHNNEQIRTSRSVSKFFEAYNKGLREIIPENTINNTQVLNIIKILSERKYD